MSMATCHDCGRYVDTDFDPASWIEIGNMRRQTRTVCICDLCRCKRDTEDERQAAQEGMAMEQAEQQEASK